TPAGTRRGLRGHDGGPCHPCRDATCTTQDRTPDAGPRRTIDLASVTLRSALGARRYAWWSDRPGAAPGEPRPLTEGNVRSFWRWSLACVVPTVVGAAVWLALEWGLHLDRGTAAAAGVGVSAIVLAPMCWWAAREPKSS